MADAVTTFSGLANDAPNVLIGRKMYKLAERRLALGQAADKYQLESRMGKTLRIVRFRRLSLPTQTLVEGVPPDTNALTMENVDVTVEQWGIVVLLTDVVQLTVTHPVLQIAVDRTSMAISETLEREMAQMLLAGTVVIFPDPTTNTSRADLLAADVLSTAVILNATTQLRAKGAPDMGDGLYLGVMQPQHEGDVLASDQSFQDASNFARVRKLEYAEIGIWMGVDWVRGNFLPIFVGVATPDGSAATATKAQFVAATTGGSLATGNYQIKVVGREVGTDYERRISQQTGNIAVTGPTGSITVSTPTSLNYVYDIYLTAVGGTTAFKVKSRIPGNSSTVLMTAPAGTEPTAPASPASGTTVFPGWIFGASAWGRVELDGMSLQTYMTPAGASWSNPLAQGRKVGAKLMWKSFIIENNFMVRFETGSAFPAFLPA